MFYMMIVILASVILGLRNLRVSRNAVTNISGLLLDFELPHKYTAFYSGFT